MTILLISIANSATFYVGEDGDFSTIADALQEAHDGDTILVAADANYEGFTAEVAAQIIVDGDEGATLVSTAALVADGASLVGFTLDVASGPALTVAADAALTDLIVDETPAGPDGAIVLQDAAVEISGLSCTANEVPCVYAAGADVSVHDSTFILNSADAGGAIFAQAGSLEISDSYFSSNLGRYGGGSRLDGRR